VIAPAGAVPIASTAKTSAKSARILRKVVLPDL
jgi:hypothetical protein